VKVRRAIAGVLLVATAAAPAHAATYRVDDSATLPAESTALLRWRRVAPSRDADNTLEGALAVAVRLQLAPWLDRRARLYLVCPEQGTAPVRVSWQSQGRLLGGEISPGERVLVYQGDISSPILEETLTLQIEADGARLAGLQRLRFHFEIDTD
jgi:hypothetical protein